MSKQITDPNWYKPNGRYFNPLNVRPSILKPTKQDWEKIRFKFRDCPITGRPLNDNYDLDHDHKSFFCRGFLCKAANNIMGKLDAIWREENYNLDCTKYDVRKIIYNKAEAAVDKYIIQFRDKYDTSYIEENKKDIIKATLNYKLNNWQHKNFLIVYPRSRQQLVTKYKKLGVKHKRYILHKVYGYDFYLDADLNVVFRKLFY